jgi:hypothetical protein
VGSGAIGDLLAVDAILDFMEANDYPLQREPAMKHNIWEFW